MIEYFVLFLVLLATAVVLNMIFNRSPWSARRTDSSLYVEALQELLDGHRQAAFGKLRQVVSEDSGNIDAYLRLGRLLREHKKPERALQVHKDLALRGTLSESNKVYILKELFLDYSELGDTSMARSALQELISMLPSDRWAHAALLDIYKSAGEWEAAYDAAVKVLKLESNKSKKPLAPLRYQIGLGLYRKREYHKARVLFKEAIGLDPSFVPSYLAIGDSYCDEERFEDAVSIWTRLMEANPDQGHRVISRLKKTLFDLGRYGDIGEMCESILHHSPKNLEARFALAEFHEKKGDLDSAESILVEIIDATPDNLKAILELIRTYLDKGEHKKIAGLLRDLEHKQSGRSVDATTAPLANMK